MVINKNAILVPILGEPLNGAVKNACCEAFAQYILDNYLSIQLICIINL